MSLRSKRIEDYFSVELSTLVPDREIPFEVCLYFPLNMHILIWKKPGELITAEFLNTYAQRGAKLIWIHVHDRPIYERYLNPDSAPTAEEKAEITPKPEASVEPDKRVQPDPGPQAASRPKPKPIAPPEPRSEEAKELIEAIQAKDVPVEKKKEAVKKVAQKVVEEAFLADTIEGQQKANKKAREVVQDMLAKTASETQSFVAECWKLGDEDIDMEHAVNVATYTVLFSMAFGKVDPELLGDMATAGLLHDIGVSQIPGHIANTPWQQMDAETLAEYSKHVEYSLALIDQIGTEVPQRVKDIILQHHEKFDGSGYPKKLEGFQFDDVAQILALADLTESIGSGQLDGTRRTMKEAILYVEKFEKNKSFPEYFNPEIFSELIKWIRKADQSHMTQAAKIVSETTKKVTTQDAA